MSMEAERAMRMHHMLWHTARDGWERFGPDVRAAYERFGWAPPRPALDASGGAILTNDSGEDFFYMHRQMIEEVNRVLARINDPQYSRVLGWAEFPTPGNADYGVPPAYPIGNVDDNAWLTRIKSDEYFTQTFLPAAEKLRNPDYVKSISLGELGARVEFSVHNWAHMRWSSKPEAFRPNPKAANPIGVDEKWDNPSYDWLGDFYSSHVNPLFWKLHGWVDDCVSVWQEAHGIKGPYEWKGKWTGKVPTGSMTGMHEQLLAAPEGKQAQELAKHVDQGNELLKASAVEGVQASPFRRVEISM
jgi:hypothetical protein